MQDGSTSVGLTRGSPVAQVFNLCVFSVHIGLSWDSGRESSRIGGTGRRRWDVCRAAVAPKRLRSGRTHTKPYIGYLGVTWGASLQLLNRHWGKSLQLLNCDWGKSPHPPLLEGSWGSWSHRRKTTFLAEKQGFSFFSRRSAAIGTTRACLLSQWCESPHDDQGCQPASGRVARRFPPSAWSRCTPFEGDNSWTMSMWSGHPDRSVRAGHSRRQMSCCVRSPSPCFCRSCRWCDLNTSCLSFRIPTKSISIQWSPPCRRPVLVQPASCRRCSRVAW